MENNSNYYELLSEEEPRSMTWDFSEDDDPQERRPVKWDTKFVTQLVKETEVAENYHTGSVSTFWSRTRGMEAGDDRVDQSNSPKSLAMSIVGQSKVFKMITSEDDTVISSRLFNFCEVTSPIPAASESSFDVARRTGDASKLMYADVPPLRVIIDVGKDEISHSSTTSGKAKLLSGRIGLCNDSIRTDLHIASFLQDAYLSAWKTSPEPKYLPQFVGGSGHAALFDMEDNLYLSVKGFHQGGYDRIYGSAVNEAIYVLADLEKGQPASAVLCDYLRLGQDYLMGTYANIVTVPVEARTSFYKEQGMPKPVYQALSSNSLVRATEARLERARLLINEEKAAVEWNRTERFMSMLFTFIPVTAQISKRGELERESRAKYFGALRSNSAYKNLLDRTAKPSDVMKLDPNLVFSNYGVTEFTKRHAHWIFNGSKSETLTVDSIPHPRAMYVRDEVSVETSLKVAGIPLLSAIDNKIRYTTTRVGLYEISTSQYEWAERTLNRLLAPGPLSRPLNKGFVEEVYSLDREWVNDDTFIIKEVLEESVELPSNSSVILVSADNRLAKRIANSTGLLVARIHPGKLLRAYPDRIWDSQSKLEVKEIMELFRSKDRDRSIKPYAVKIDYGSLAAFAARAYVYRGSVMEHRLVEAGFQNNNSYAEFEIFKPEKEWDSWVNILPTSAKKVQPIRTLSSTAAKYAVAEEELSDESEN